MAMLRNRKTVRLIGVRPAASSNGTATMGMTAMLSGPWRSVKRMTARPPTAPQMEFIDATQAAPFAPKPMSSRTRGPQKVKKKVDIELAIVGGP